MLKHLEEVPQFKLDMEENLYMFSSTVSKKIEMLCEIFGHWYMVQKKQRIYWNNLMSGGMLKPLIFFLSQNGEK